jgi:hypothetical protein
VESQEWWTPGDPLVDPPRLQSVVLLEKWSDPARTERREAMAYNADTECDVYDWQIGSRRGGLQSGSAVLAIPLLAKDNRGITSELAITNVVPKPGFTDFALFVYDQNGLLDYICEKLNEKQVEYIDLNTWGYINNGFKGSAIISAVFWEHDVFDKDGFFLRNLVGLGAVAVERSKTFLGQDIPGDEAAGARGIPFRQSDVEDAEFEFGFMGEQPACPGVPLPKPPGPGEGPSWVCPPASISGELGGSVNWPDWDDSNQSTRIYRDGVSSGCAPPKACPGGGYAGGGYVQTVYFDNPDGKEVCVTVTSGNGSCWAAYDAHASAFTGRYPAGTPWACDPEPGVTYLGDNGGSPAGPGESFGFTIPAGVEEWTLYVENNFSAVNCDWEFLISGFDCQ